MEYRSRPSKVVFITGAGLSADSGVATYRGSGGVYEGMRAEEVMTAGTLKNNPGFIQAFCDDRRVELAGKTPNDAHKMIARLAADYGDRVVHLTQNIDDLMEKAGNSTTGHLHGFLTSMRSIGNSKVVEDIGYTRYWDGDAALAPARGFKFRCPKSNSHYRPDVVLFGEAAPEYAKLYRQTGNLSENDVLVVIGTQGSVLPVSRFADFAPSFSILNNLHSSQDIKERFFSLVLMKRASEAAEEIEGIVREKLGHALVAEPAMA